MIRPYWGKAFIDASEQYTDPFYVFPGGSHRWVRPLGGVHTNRFPWLVAGVWQNLYVQTTLSPNDLSVASITFDIMKNGSTTGMQIVLTGAQKTGSYTAATVSANGTTDTFSLRMSHTPGRASIGQRLDTYTYIEFDSTNDKESGSGYVGYNGPNGPDLNANGVYHFSDTFEGAATSRGMNVTGPPGDITGYRILLPSNPGGTLTYRIEKNGIVQDGTNGTVNTVMTMTTGEQDKTASFTLPVVTGDYVRLLASASGMANGLRPSVCTRFLATDDLEFQLGGFNAQMATSGSAATDYVNVVGCPTVFAFSTVLASMVFPYIGPEDIDVEGLVVYNSGAPGAGVTRDVDVVIDTVPVVGGPTVQLTGTASPQVVIALSGTAIFDTGNEIALRIRTVGLAGNTSDSAWAFASARAETPPPPTPGTIIVIKMVNPDIDTTEFDFTAGGGLAPESFSLSHGEQQEFADVPVGSGYSIEEDVPANYIHTIEVSNGSDPENISVADSETVTVTVTNTRRGAFGCPATLDVTPADGQGCNANIDDGFES